MPVIHFLQFVVLSICINSFVVFMYIVYYSDTLINTFDEELKVEYDFIIVGSGTAGSVIAHRLAKETNYTFIVLEAGGRSHPLFDVPVLGPLLHGSIYDWQYETVPQENACFAMKDKKCQIFQGKIIGGSSKLNNMVHVRGNISHYINWFDGKYSADYINKQFDFIENNILHLNEIQYQSELTDAVLDAAKELGYHRIDIGFNKGFRKSKLSQKNGKRWSTSDNLDNSKHIKTNVFVDTVIFNENVAYGVNVLISDNKKEIYARKAVILSAGTLNTPKILQLSGVGPAELLKSLHIPLIKDLPVGKNLQDHITTGLDLIMFDNSLSISTIDMLNLFHAANYFIYGKGPFTTPGCEVVGFLSTKNESNPDLQFMVLPVGISSDRGSHLRKNLALKDEVWEKYFVKTFDKHTATILPIILHPKSKGEVLIHTRDPKLPPRINPKYLSKKEDITTLINGLKLVVNFVETEAMKNIGAYINPLPFPGCEHYKLFTNNYWECYIKHLTLTSYHPIGTCSMGLSESKNSVVDNSFKVLGVEGLYVVDGSVLPTLPSGNINAAIAMMASIFVDANILTNLENQKTKYLVCQSNDFIYEYLYNICFTK